jgi:hypothetical protein
MPPLMGQYVETTMNIVLKQFAVKYLLAAMVSWVPIANQVSNGESAESAQARYEATASDIIETVYADDEPAVFLGADGNIKSALELAAIGSFEGGFQKFVDEGGCNVKGFKADRRGSCDGGTAYTIWQIHPMSGLMLKGTGITSVYYNQQAAKEHPEDVWTGAKLVADRKMAAKVALHLIRISYQEQKSLCRFTGESCLEGKHPLADNRHMRAVNYLKAHPFTPPKEEVTTETSATTAMSETTKKSL